MIGAMTVSEVIPAMDAPGKLNGLLMSWLR